MIDNPPCPHCQTAETVNYHAPTGMAAYLCCVRCDHRWDAPRWLNAHRMYTAKQAALLSSREWNAYGLEKQPWNTQLRLAVARDTLALVELKHWYIRELAASAKVILPEVA